MAVWFIYQDGEFAIWQSCEIGDYANGHIVGLGDDLEEAKADAVTELLDDASAVAALDASQQKERPRFL